MRFESGLEFHIPSTANENLITVVCFYEFYFKFYEKLINVNFVWISSYCHFFIFFNFDHTILNGKDACFYRLCFYYFGMVLL
jgi:hypothetical protein